MKIKLKRSNQTRFIMRDTILKSMNNQDFLILRPSRK